MAGGQVDLNGHDPEMLAHHIYRDVLIFPQKITADHLSKKPLTPFAFPEKLNHDAESHSEKSKKL